MSEQIEDYACTYTYTYNYPLENIESSSPQVSEERVGQLSGYPVTDTTQLSHSIVIPESNRVPEQTEMLTSRGWPTSLNQVRPSITEAYSNSMSLTSWLNVTLPRQEAAVVQAPEALANTPVDSFVITVEDQHPSLYSLSQNLLYAPYHNHNNVQNTRNDNFHDNTQEAPSSTNDNSRSNNVVSSNRNDDDNSNNDERNSNRESHTEDQSVDAWPMRPEVQQVIKGIKNHLPFVALLIAKAIYDHRSGTLCLVLLLIVFIKANNDLKREIGKQEARSRKTLFHILCYIFGVFGIISLILNDYSLFFIYSMKESLSFWDLLWSVTVTDFVVKLFTVALKTLVTCLPANLLAFQKRGRCYLWMEAASQFYRSTIPMHSWMSYFKEAYQGPEVILGIIMALLYGATKIRDLLFRGKLLVNAFVKFWHNISLGSPPTKEELVASGGTCVICQEEYSNPVQLHCSHIFCDSCVSIWLDRERTCPLCRFPITDDPVYRDGHTTQFIQFY